MTYLGTVTLKGLTIGQPPYQFEEAPKGYGVTARGGRQPVMTGGRRPLGPDVADGREMSFPISILASTAAAVEALVDPLLAAWAPSSTIDEITVGLAAGDRNRRGRSIGVDVDYQLLPTGAAARARCVFEVMDPRWYATTLQSVTVTAGGASGGIASPPVSPPVTTGGGGASADASVTNAGTTAAPWTVTLNGPLTTPRLMLAGQTVQVDGDIPAGSIAVVDSLSRSVLFDGQPRPWVSYLSTWWEIPTGTSTFSLRATAGTGTATLRWRDASF